jgi:hypothetical protein
MDLFDQTGKEVSATIIPNSVVLIHTDIGAKYVDTYLKVRAGVRSSPIIQSAARAFVFVLGSV